MVEATTNKIPLRLPQAVLAALALRPLPGLTQNAKVTQDTVAVWKLGPAQLILPEDKRRFVVHKECEAALRKAIRKEKVLKAWYSLQETCTASSVCHQCR